MKTLVELYSESPLDNVLGTEQFRPERTVFICPDAVACDEKLRKNMGEYFRRRGIPVRCEFMGASPYDVREIEACIRKAMEGSEDCALDVSGGTDAALFASGSAARGGGFPVYTYSRRANSFYEIQNAPFAHSTPCTVTLDTTSCILMAGGSVRSGRTDNEYLMERLDVIDPFFRVFMRHRAEWTSFVTYVQEISQDTMRAGGMLWAEGPWEVAGQRSSRHRADPGLLRELEEIGLVRDLHVEQGVGTAFAFPDEHVRFWLRDIGCVLELYTFKACLDAGIFDDVMTSVVVDWNTGSRNDEVTNEIDVTAVSGVMPVFISCKTSDVKTEALNELSVLRDRFGGRASRAAVVTSHFGRPQMRARASQLGIDVIDLKDLNAGLLPARLRALAQRRA